MNTPVPQSSDPAQLTQRLRAPLALVLVGGISLLILLSVGSVLFVSLREASQSTFSLLADKADSNLSLLEAQLETQLGPVEAAGTELAIRIGEGAYAFSNTPSELHQLLRGALTALPRATAVSFIDIDAKAVRIARIDDKIVPIPEDPFLMERQKFVLQRAATLEKPTWIEPVWAPHLAEPVLSMIAPVHRNGVFIGAVAVSARLGEIATFLKAIEKESGVRAFILYGDRYVLGHPELLEQGYSQPDTPSKIGLPTIDTFEEEAFRLLHADVQRAEQLIKPLHVDDAPLDDEFILLIREIHSYGDTPWQIALRFDRSEVSVEISRLKTAGFTGLAILLFAMAIGYLFTRYLSNRIGRFATTAVHLRNLDVANLPPLPDSWLRELATAANAFNSQIAAMHWFETYVPKALVLRLMQLGETALRSEERNLSIMFTDIRGFSTLVEHMSPAETADLLNRHFALLATCIEAEGGTVDKFIGDAVMAFWGAPEAQQDHAARALRTALAMHAAMSAENARCRAAGQPTIALRIGVHTGPVIVGNIGSQNRYNYTVIGDTVNVAARLESYAKELMIDADCLVLVSGATLRSSGTSLPAGTQTEQLGDIPVRGREGTIDAIRLIP